MLTRVTTFYRNSFIGLVPPLTEGSTLTPVIINERQEGTVSTEQSEQPQQSKQSEQSEQPEQPQKQIPVLTEEMKNIQLPVLPFIFIYLYSFADNSKRKALCR